MESEQAEIALYAGLMRAEPGSNRNTEADKWVPFDADKANHKEIVMGKIQTTLVELLEFYHSAKQAH